MKPRVRGSLRHEGSRRPVSANRVEVYKSLPLLTCCRSFNENTLDNDILKMIGKKRGCLIKGGEIDMERATKILLTDFRAAKLGKICLE